MKKLIIILIGLIFVGGCYIPAHHVGIRPAQIEIWEERCVIKTKKNGEKTTHCRWVRVK